MKRIHFFATPADIVPVLERFEANAPLKFVETGSRTTPNRAIYLESADIPYPGISTHETGSQSSSLMVSLRDTKNHMRVQETKSGSKYWNLYNGDNEETVTLTLAGRWRGDMLLPGIMDTLHADNETAQQLMRWFLSALKKEGFAKVGIWWLGKEALEMLNDGKRLSTTAEQSPPEYDLKMPTS